MAGDVPVGLWRVPHTKISAHGSSIIMDHGKLSLTAGCFTDTAVGARPIALIGTYDEIVGFINENPTKKIRNDIEELPDIYMSTSYFNPSSKQLRGLFPGIDAATGIATGLTAIAGAGTSDFLRSRHTSFASKARHVIQDAFAAVTDGISLSRELSGNDGGGAATHGRLIVKLHYMANSDGSGEVIGSGSITMDDLEITFYEQFSEL